jgi:transposase InsO family protein
MKELISWAGMPRRTFYYKPYGGTKGRPKTTHTYYRDQLVSDEKVIEEIRQILSQPYCCYGYHNVTDDLKKEGYAIGDKKVYRLMSEQDLLLGKSIICKGKREFVKFRRIVASKPLEYLCLDIKYVWVKGESRWYYLLSIMDVYSRRILEWIFQKSVRQIDVVNRFRLLHLRYNLKGVVIRNDNGSQFLASSVRQTLQQMEARQEFTHVATPEENAYIEAFHSIMQRELIDRYEFASYYEAMCHIKAYTQWYNQERKHGSLGKKKPQQIWDQFFGGSSLKQREEALSEPMSRPTDKELRISLDIGGENAYFCLKDEPNKSLLLNSFEKVSSL